MLNWIYTWLGLSNGSGPIYLFWSGFFGDITIFAALGALYLHHICTDPTCHRYGRHKFKGSPYCRKHHPEL